MMCCEFNPQPPCTSDWYLKL